MKLGFTQTDNKNNSLLIDGKSDIGINDNDDQQKMLFNAKHYEGRARLKKLECCQNRSKQLMLAKELIMYTPQISLLVFNAVIDSDETNQSIPINYGAFCGLRFVLDALFLCRANQSKCIRIPQLLSLLGLGLLIAPLLFQMPEPFNIDSSTLNFNSNFTDVEDTDFVFTMLLFLLPSSVDTALEILHYCCYAKNTDYIRQNSKDKTAAIETQMSSTLNAEQYFDDDDQTEEILSIDNNEKQESSTDLLTKYIRYIYLGVYDKLEQLESESMQINCNTYSRVKQIIKDLHSQRLYLANKIKSTKSEQKVALFITQYNTLSMDYNNDWNKTVNAIFLETKQYPKNNFVIKHMGPLHKKVIGNT